LTIWNFVGLWFGLAAYAVAWTWGGRPERFAAGISISYCLLSYLTYRWEIGGLHPAGFVEDCVRLLVFGWLCLRSARWWPFVATAGILLKVVVYVPVLLDPRLSEISAFSAQVGLGYLVDLSLMLSAFERRLAGESPARRAAWAAADMATTARRKRKEGARAADASRTAPGSGGAVLPRKEFRARRFPSVLARIAEKG